MSTIVLARLLTPTDFGLVAMVTAVTVIASGFADLGLTEATIQRKDITHRQVSTLFWINVGMGLFLTLLTAAMAPLLAKFYREPKLFGITLVASVSFLIGGLRGQHNALLKRQMRFKSVAIRDIISSLLGVIVAVAVALRGGGYWAILAMPLTVNFSQLVLSCLMVRWKPGLPHLDAQTRSILGFGGNVAIILRHIQLGAERRQYFDRPILGGWPARFVFAGIQSPHSRNQPNHRSDLQRGDSHAQ